MATQAELDAQLVDAAAACTNAAVRGMEAALTATFSETPDFNAATAFAAWANQSANTGRELLSALRELRSSVPAP
jgi:hypothetical protein